MSEKNLPVGNLADILALNNSDTVTVDVPEWNCSVKVKALSKADQIAVRRRAVRNGKLDEAELEGLLFVHGVVEPKFQPEHIAQLLQLNSGAFDRVLKKVLHISGMTDEAEKEAEETFQD